ncbi:MAG: 2-oxoglutarate dehydrogenase complex dihydrolipoyllysine-residue succinyltransferase, partial [Bacteroidia bacterium]
MAVEIKVPSPGESITEVQISNWLKKDGDYVERDEELCEIDSDKATLTISAEEAGKLKILIKEGETVKVGEVICSIDTDAKSSDKPKAEKVQKEEQNEKESAKINSDKEKVSEEKSKEKEESKTTYADKIPSVAAKKLMEEHNISADKVNATGRDGRITKGDVLEAIENNGGNGVQKNQEVEEKETERKTGSREQRREKLSMLRKKIAERLVAVKNETAMLTTFNEVDMSAIMEIRKKYKDKFKEKHGIGLGFMSFFTKAVTNAFYSFPAINAMIDGDEIIYHYYADVGIAVSTPKGLMVPVIRNAESKSIAEIEVDVMELAVKARDGKISLDDMKGGTFTITNGGVFGSLMSTPIINPPQSAILGMHNILERPVAINGKVEIRPMMYVALSYDHRIIDGKES